VRDKLKDFLKAKERFEQLSAELEREQGARNQLLKQLRKDFGCKTIKAARKLKADLERGQAKLEKAFDAAMKQLRKKYPDIFKE
jgi:hypothetical protein